MNCTKKNIYHSLTHSTQTCGCFSMCVILLQMKIKIKQKMLVKLCWSGRLHILIAVKCLRSKQPSLFVSETVGKPVCLFTNFSQTVYKVTFSQ